MCEPTGRAGRRAGRHLRRLRRRTATCPPDNARGLPYRRHDGQPRRRRIRPRPHLPGRRRPPGPSARGRLRRDPARANRMLEVPGRRNRHPGGRDRPRRVRAPGGRRRPPGRVRGRGALPRGGGGRSSGRRGVDVERSVGRALPGEVAREPSGGRPRPTACAAPRRRAASREPHGARRGRREGRAARQCRPRSHRGGLRLRSPRPAGRAPSPRALRRRTLRVGKGTRRPRRARSTRRARPAGRTRARRARASVAARRRRRLAPCLRSRRGTRGFPSPPTAARRRARAVARPARRRRRGPGRRSGSRGRRMRRARGRRRPAPRTDR